MFNRAWSKYELEYKLGYYQRYFYRERCNQIEFINIIYK